MKEFIWSMVILLVAMILSFFFFYGHCEAKEIDLSITGTIGYGGATWGSGLSPQPGGTLYDSAPAYGVSAQIKYSRWRLQPTIEFDYRWVSHNFNNLQAPTQAMDSRAWSLLGGLTYGLGKMFFIYGLIGYTNYSVSVDLMEVVPKYKHEYIPKVKIINHGRGIGFEDDLFTYKIGAYKLFKIGPIKVGPELNIQGWNRRPGWSRCREGRELAIQPNIGLRIQW